MHCLTPRIRFRDKSLIWPQLRPHNLRPTTKNCCQPQRKLYHYYCYYDLGMKPVCGAGCRKLGPNLALMPSLGIFCSYVHYTYFDSTHIDLMPFLSNDTENAINLVQLKDKNGATLSSFNA